MDLRLLENESLLLLYLAGELPEADRAELDAQLAVDPALRSQLETMRGLHGGFESTLEEMDRVDPVTPSAASFRNISRAMQQWNVDRLARPKVVTPPAKKIPVWGWSIGSVAAAVLLFCVWWGFKSDAAPHGPATDALASSQPNESPSTPDYARNEWRHGRWRDAQDGGEGAPGEDSVALSMDPASRGLTVLEQAVGEEMR